MNLWADSGGGAATARSRGRRRFAFVAMLLFMLSLLVQYASFVGTPPALAVHDEGIFELEGNATDQGGQPGDDWQNGTPGAADTLFIGMDEEEEGPDDSYFTTGGSKDENELSEWKWSSTDVAPDKDELLDVFAAVYEDGADTLVYFGADKLDDSGDAQIGFWFFQDEVSLNANGNFNGTHTVGDVLVLSDFTNGGEVDLICVYEWNPTGDNDISGTECDENDSDNLDLVAAGAECDVSTPDGTFDVCAAVNPGTENPGTQSHAEGFETAYWDFENKDGHAHYDKGQFFEGGINLSQLFGGDAPCFSTFLAETRSSQETDAQLKDFALGSLDTCVPPELETESSVSDADFGDEVTDTATLSGSHGAVKGTITFFICEPDEVTAAGCPEGEGTQVGDPVDIGNDDEAESEAYTVGLTADAVGKYCWRAEYEPAEDSEYLATSHTNATTECFEVAPATIKVEKEADDASVNAGEQIGFTVTITNTGANTALGVTLDDPLPGGPGVSWAIDGAANGFSISGTAPNQELEFGPASLAAGASRSVHIVSDTTAASCGEYDNTAEVTTTNDGSDEASDSTEVLCAEIDIDKLADDGLDAGSTRSDLETFDAPAQIGFLITVTNNGDGTATNVVVDDTLPALPSGADWALSPAVTGCALSGTDNRELDCTFASLAAGASVQIHVVANAVYADCNDADNSITLPNTASVTTGNDGDDEDSATVVVNCADIDIDKLADDGLDAGSTRSDLETFDAPAQIGFLITVTNNGAGAATNVVVSDTLPGLPSGADWALSPAVTGCALSGTDNRELDCTFASLAAGASVQIHVVANAVFADCNDADNTIHLPNLAEVTTGNDGSDEDAAAIDVNCAEIDIEKLADDGIDAGSVRSDLETFDAPATIGFLITVSNNGSGAATNLVVADTLPALPSGADWSIDPSVPGCALSGTDNRELDCTFASLAAGASVDIHVVANAVYADCNDADNSITLPNTAEVTSDNAGSDEDSATVVVNCADIDVEKTADAAEVNAGEEIGFTVTLSNTGAAAATGLAFTDNLPGGPGINWSVDAANSDAGWSITGTAPNQQLVYAPTSLAAGASTTVHVVSATTGESCGLYNNTASIETGNDGSDSDSASTEVLCADIDVEKDSDDDSVNAGEQIGFTVTLSNNGDGEAKGLNFSDPLPGGAGISWTIESQDGGFSITGSAPNQSLVYGPSTLAAHTSVSVHIVSDTTAASCATYNNTASVSTSNDGQDSDSAETQVRCADIDVEKEADAPSVNAGEQIGFTVTLSNDGDGLATGLAFTDNLPAGDGVSWSIDAANSDAGWSITGTAPNQQLVYSPTTLAAHTSVEVHIVSDTTAASCGVYDNTASVTTGNDGSDSDSDSTEVLCAEIDVDKVADDDAVEAGGQIGFTVTISNNGAGTAKGLAFTDALPGGPGISWSIESQSGGFSITGTAPDQDLVFAPTELAGESSAWVHIVSATTAESCGLYDNTAQVTTTNDGSDEASDDVMVECPVLAIEKTVAETLYTEVGQVLHYTIKVTNVGNVTLENVVVTDEQADPGSLDCEPDLPVPTLLVDESFFCTATYTIVEADFDTLLVTNVACADDGMGDGEVGANPVCDDVSTPGQEVEEETSPPTQPPTDSVLGDDNSAPGGSAWLLILGLAISLSALVFMTPARARSRR